MSQKKVIIIAVIAVAAGLLAYNKVPQVRTVLGGGAI